MQVVYHINPGPVHKLMMVEITGNKDFMDTKALLSRMEIQPAARFLNHGRYSGILLKSDVATIEGLYRSNGFRDVKIQTNVDDNYRGSNNQLAVHIHIDEGPQTRVSELHIVGNQKMATSQFPELNTQPGQAYSEQSLANDRESISLFTSITDFPTLLWTLLRNPPPSPIAKTLPSRLRRASASW
jgi:outer membrane protein assembly factor BamA